MIFRLFCLTSLGWGLTDVSSRHRADRSVPWKVGSRFQCGGYWDLVVWLVMVLGRRAYAYFAPVGFIGGEE